MQPLKKRKRDEGDELALVLSEPEKKTSKKALLARKFPTYKKKDTTHIIIRGPNIIPDQYSVKMVYSNLTTIASTSGAVGTNQYRGNSLFDPDYSGTGTQPSGFDELASLYERYRVLGSTCIVNFVSNTSQNDDLCVFPTNTATLVGTDNTIRAEYPYAQRKIANVYQAPPSNTRFAQYMSTSKMYGVSKQKVRDEEDYSAATTANPSNSFFWNVSYQAVDRASTQSLYYTIRIEYYCTFYKRRALNQS